jgi:CRP/FNR family transcriptional regulator, cyclic AMP receptor protein
MKSKGENVSEILIFLASVPMFSTLGESSLLLLAWDCSFRQLEKGGILFFQSDPSDSAYVVCSGKISIVLSSPDGREIVINEMKRGDLFGELGILTNKPRSTCAVGRTGCRLLEIPRATFLSVLEAEPGLALRLLRVMADRLHLSGQRESALAFMNAQARLARFLLELEEQEQDKGYVTISQEELAHRTGLIRQTVAKALGKWRRAGWLITGRGRILVLDRKALEDLERNSLI